MKADSFYRYDDPASSLCPPLSWPLAVAASSPSDLWVISSERPRCSWKRRLSESQKRKRFPRVLSVSQKPTAGRRNHGPEPTPQQPPTSPFSLSVVSSRPDSLSVDSGRPDSLSVDSGRPDSLSVESGRPDSLSVDSGRPDSLSVDSSRPDSLSVDSGRPES
ncbi:unnamed protein product [Gadus morhua 'NCC']